MQPNRNVALDERERQARAGAKVVMISLKAEIGWLKALAVDAELSHVAVRVALVLAQYFNGESGETYVRQDTLAAKIGASERTVWAALKELEDRRWIIVKRRELGQRGDGRRVCGGKGVANTYLPAVQGTQLTATNAASMLATCCDLWTGKGRSPLRPLEGQSSQNGAPKVATCCDPTLTDPSDQNSTGASARATGTALPAMFVEALRERLGKVWCGSWLHHLTFGEVRLGKAGAVLVLEAPTRFIAERVECQDGQAIAFAFNAGKAPGERVQSVSIRVRASGGNDGT